MRLSTVAVTLACGALALGCGDRPTQPPAPPASFEVVPAPSCSPVYVESLIRSLFAGVSRSNAMQRLTRIERLLRPVAPGTDTARARVQALEFLAWIQRRYGQSLLIGDQSAATQDRVRQLLNAILCRVGLPPAFFPGTLGENGASAYIFPATPDTVVVTGTGWAGVDVPQASVGQPSLVTITPRPSTSRPLLTAFDQYPLYYEFHVVPDVPFTQDVLVGVCQPTDLILPLGVAPRLRVGHNIAPYTFGSVEILPVVAAPFLDCSNAISAAPFHRLLDLAGRVVSPRALFAATRAAAGIGGTVRTFSPFGAVDTLGVITPISRLVQVSRAGWLLDQPPAVRIRTPSGRPVRGITVTFAVTLGNSTLGSTSAVTDSAGVARAGVWRLGTMTTEVTATATAPQGTGFTGNNVVFRGNIIP